MRLDILHVLYLKVTYTYCVFNITINLLYYFEINAQICGKWYLIWFHLIQEILMSTLQMYIRSVYSVEAEYHLSVFVSYANGSYKGEYISQCW